MLLREIFNPDETTLPEAKEVSVFLENKIPKHTLKKALAHSVILHIVFFALIYFITQVLVFILMFFGIYIDLFKRPELKIRDIDFVFVLPEKYDINKSFKTNTQGKKYSLAGPEPNNRAYNEDKGSLKSNAKDKNIPKDKIVNTKPAVSKKQASSQTTIAASKESKKGSFIPKIEEPELFTAVIPQAEMNSDLGWGKQGANGIQSPDASNSSFQSSGDGASGAGIGDSIGNGTTNGGGYYYGSAGAPRPQTANSYKNESLDVDLRPYVTELQRKVLRNWAMPKNDNDKKTVLFIRISKTGNLMILNIKTPSGDTYTDNLAISAVKKAQPFPPLPTGYRNAYADIILTFDYNVSAREN